MGLFFVDYLYLSDNLHHTQVHMKHQMSPIPMSVEKLLVK